MPVEIKTWLRGHPAAFKLVEQTNEVEMLEASVTSSLAKLTNSQGRPVNEFLDVFFLGLRSLYQITTVKEATAGTHHNGKPHSDYPVIFHKFFLGCNFSNLTLTGREL